MKGGGQSCFLLLLVRKFCDGRVLVYDGHFQSKVRKLGKRKKFQVQLMQIKPDRTFWKVNRITISRNSKVTSTTNYQ